MAKEPTQAIHNYPMVRVERGKFVPYIDKRDVVILAVSGKWAMVRRPGAVPYVAALDQIERIE